MKCVLRLLPMLLCAATPTLAAAPSAIVQALPSVASSGSQYPHLYDANGQVYMSWLQQDEGEQVSLWFASLQGNKWSPATAIASGDNWFVNWADFPSLVVLKDGTLVAHWLQKTALDSYAYDVRLALSADHGKHWQAPFSPHDDGTTTEHGFVSLLPQPDNTLAAVWLDGRESKHDEEKMQLRYARFDSEGKKLSEKVLDSDTCTCCQTTAVVVPGGIAVGYRDHAAIEIRDIAVMRLQGDQLSEATRVHADNWEIPGCPVNGPAMASHGNDLAIAWYTGAQQIPRVQLAFSADGGETFSAPTRMDDGAPQGRVAVVMTSARSAIVSWLERDGEHSALRVRRAERNHANDVVFGPAVTVARTSLARSSGFPRLALQNDNVIVAWTHVVEHEPPQVRTAALRLTDLIH